MADGLTEIAQKKSIVYQGSFLQFHLDQVTLPNGKTASREYLHHPGAVAAVPLLEDGRVILVRQFRYPTGLVLLEIPAGKMDRGEQPEDAVRRELAEEIGYEPKTIHHLTSIWTTPAFTDEVIHLYLATDLQPCATRPDPDEFLEVVFMSKAELLAALNSQSIVDAKTVLAITLLELKKMW